jgi:hypothetical protein
MQIAPGLDLTYCTNIHPGESWAEVKASVAQYALPLKQRLAPKAPFGIGLRLSAQAARELCSGNNLRDFRAWLDDNGCYVALLNGFPYGQFHGTRIKEQVFAPDWRTPERLNYTLDLIEILAELLPAGMDGGISTMPLAYKPEIGALPDWSEINGNLAKFVAQCVRQHERSGKIIHLDIEPEPGGLVESTGELIDFFTRQQGRVAEQLSALLKRPPAQAEDLVQQHIRVCFDTCHLAVKFEDVAASLRRLSREGIQIGRVQFSSALRAGIPAPAEFRDRALDKLRPFAESTYLHQTVQRLAGGTTVQHSDLPVALACDQDGEQEWRIHYHVPLFVSEYDGLSSTSSENVAALRALAEQRMTAHIEIETYTWEVLPAGLKTDLVSSIEREYRWVLDQFAGSSRLAE